MLCQTEYGRTPVRTCGAHAKKCLVQRRVVSPQLAVVCRAWCRRRRKYGAPCRYYLRTSRPTVGLKDLELQENPTDYNDRAAEDDFSPGAVELVFWSLRIYQRPKQSWKLKRGPMKAKGLHRAACYVWGV